MQTDSDGELIDFLTRAKSGKEEPFARVATTLEEAQTLIESGFEYVTSMQIGNMTYQMFRKKNLGGLYRIGYIPIQ